MIEFLNNLDTSAFLAINGYHTTFLDNFMLMFTERFTWLPMYIAVIWVIFKSARPKTAFLYLFMLILAITLTDQVCASVIRPIVERLRPSNPENTLSQMAYIVNDYRGGNYGFPSCHAANSFALALFIALFVRKPLFSVSILLWALLNSYSRLYLGVHYPGDLLIGAIIGCMFSCICYYAASHLAARFIPIPEVTPANTNILLIILSASLTVIAVIALF